MSSNNQCTFRRYEKKYLLDEERYRKLLQLIGERLQQDRYHISQINNIYYDTPDFRLIRRSLEKPVYKEKLRLRCYDVPTAESPVFVELKKKYKRVVYKRRVEMDYKEAETYLLCRHIPEGTQTADKLRTAAADSRKLYRDMQIEKEINWFMSFYPELQPAMYIGYDRESWAGIDDAGLRITMDRDIIWRRDMLRLDAGRQGRRLLKPGQVLMEIKAPEAYPLWLCQALTELEIYPASFSKYGRAYQTWLNNSIQHVYSLGAIRKASFINEGGMVYA